MLLQDVEDETAALEVSPDYARNEYRAKIEDHMKVLADKAAAAGLDYVFMNTGRPLDEGLRSYMSVRMRKR